MGRGSSRWRGKTNFAPAGVNSPDRADAVVLAFCGGGGKRMDEYMRAVE
jgi:hypothetical protein